VHELFEKKWYAFGFIEHQGGQLVLDVGGAEHGGEHLATVREAKRRQSEDTVVGLA